jgi:sulfur carrier protein ThiS
MRMHRGSSKGTGDGPGPETLPLSAPLPSDGIVLEVEVVRSARSVVHTITVPAESTVRSVLRRLALPVEGSAVLVGDVPIPSDAPVPRNARLVVVPTFSGG